MRISQKAFIARVNRKIAEQDLKLRVASRWTTDTLNYFVACEKTRCIVQGYSCLEGVAEDYGCLRANEVIEYVLDIWKSNACFGTDLVQIITTESETINEDRCWEHKIKEKQANIRGAIERINEELIEPLQRSTNLNIELKVKRDADNITHARFLQTKTAIIQIDSGFDFLKKDGTFKEGNSLTLRPRFFGHLKKYHSLPNTDYGN